jgi:hypothetical protein
LRLKACQSGDPRQQQKGPYRDRHQQFQQGKAVSASHVTLYNDADSKWANFSPEKSGAWKESVGSDLSGVNMDDAATLPILSLNPDAQCVVKGQRELISPFDQDEGGLIAKDLLQPDGILLPDRVESIQVHVVHDPARGPVTVDEAKGRAVHFRRIGDSQTLDDAARQKSFPGAQFSFQQNDGGGPQFATEFSSKFERFFRSR